MAVVINDENRLALIAKYCKEMAPRKSIRRVLPTPTSFPLETRKTWPEALYFGHFL